MVKDVEKDEEKESLSVPNSILLFFSLLVWINNKNTKNAIIISTGTILMGKNSHVSGRAQFKPT